jgi:pilus assembly protein CpaE
MAKINVLIQAADSALRSALIASLENSEDLQICETLGSVAELEDAVWRLAPDLILLALGEDCDASMAAIAAIGERSASVILCGPAERSDLIIQAMQLGVREYVPLPLDVPELSRVIERFAKSRSTPISPRGGAIVAVVGSKGGVGATFVTCQLAAELQSRGAMTTIIDLNSQSGDVALYHDLSPTYGIADLERESGDIDRTYLQSLLEIHSSGVGILSSSLHPNSAPNIRPSRLQHALSLIQDFSDFIIMDVPRDYGDLAVAAAELTDQFLVVTTLDVPSLAHCKLQLRVMERTGIPRHSTQIVANNTAEKTRLGDRDIRSFLGRPVDIHLPQDAPTVMEAINKGTSVSKIAERSDIALAIESLTDEVCRRCKWQTAENTPQKTGISRVRRLLWGEKHGVT